VSLKQRIEALEKEMADMKVQASNPPEVFRVKPSDVKWSLDHEKNAWIAKND